MLGMEIILNGTRLCIAGVDDEGVTAVVDLHTWRLPDGSCPASALRVFAIKDFDHLQWPGAENLQPGDEIVLRVVDVSEFDLPTRARRKSAEDDEAQERLRYEDLKRKYGRT
jgi:hypothetical protein